MNGKENPSSSHDSSSYSPCNSELREVCHIEMDKRRDTAIFTSFSKPQTLKDNKSSTVRTIKRMAHGKFLAEVLHRVE